VMHVTPHQGVPHLTTRIPVGGGQTDRRLVGPRPNWGEIVIVKRFFLEGELDGTPGLVRWFILHPADGTLRWFDEHLVQEMLRSNVATEMFSHLEVKSANAPLPSVPAESPTYRVALEDGAVAVGYLVKRNTA
jgi:hypothetical protein